MDVQERKAGFFHLHVKNISRRGGRSVVAAAAYRAGETLENEREERLSKFAGRRNVLVAEIVLPPRAPAWMADRAKLWNAVEAAEKRKDARLAKEIEFSLPLELPASQYLVVAREMADAYISRGLVVDLAVHDDGTGGNPHVHMLLTTRAVTADGFDVRKRRQDDEKTFVTEARTRWRVIANTALGKAGSSAQIDERSYAARGIDTVPGRHRGPDPVARAIKRARAREEGRGMEIMDRWHRAAYFERLAAHERDAVYAGIPESRWPPEERAPPADVGEAADAWRGFWNDVDGRAHELEAESRSRTADRDRAGPLTPLPDHVGREVREDRLGALDRAAEEARRSVDPLRIDTGLSAAREYQQLHEKIRELARKHGHDDRDNPLPDWQGILERSEAFKDRLEELRAMEARNQAFAQVRADDYPVPGPNSELLSPGELEQAQDQFVAEMNQEAVQPERGSVVPDPVADDRRMDEVERKVLEHYHERTDPPPAERDSPPPRPNVLDHLDWLRDDLQRGRQPGRDVERDRDR